MARNVVSFTSFNLFNLNQPGEEIYNNTNGWNQEQYKKKIEFTANVMNEMTADVFGFQELWHADSLYDVLGEADLEEDYTPLVPCNHKGEIVCAAAVKSGILVDNSHCWIQDFPSEFKLKSGGDDKQTKDIEVAIRSFSRPILRFQIQPMSTAPAIHVYVCHFKSKVGTSIHRETWYRGNTDKYRDHRVAIGSALSTIRRTAEATALRIILTKEMKDKDEPVVVLGDCNDGQYSNTLSILTGEPAFLTTLSRGGGDTALYSTQTLQQYRSQSDVYFTHIHKARRESVDHILVSQEFYDNSRKRVWAFDGLEIANDHLNLNNHKATGTSDHGIVRARFKYRRASKSQSRSS